MTKLRREAIRELLKIKPFLSYEELGALFPDVSEMTLRRDIEYFENSGEAIKVRGGARSARFITSSTDEAMSARMNSNVLPKAVSYTHLDVYKRQVLPKEILRLGK